MNESKHYQEQLTVLEEHLDQLDHVNNVVYLQWVQHIAEQHWRQMSPDNIQKEFIWVVLSHHIEYKKPAKQGDVLTLDTFVEGFEGVKSIRLVNIYRDKVLLVTARTEWCMLEAATMRPKRVTEEISKPFFQ